VCDLLQCLIVTIIGGDRSVMARPSWWFRTCWLIFFLLLSLFSHLPLVSTPILSKIANDLVILVLCKIYSSFFLLLFVLDHFLLILSVMARPSWWFRTCWLIFFPSPISFLSSPLGFHAHSLQNSKWSCHFSFM